MAAPGELIVNRHTEHRVNSKLGRFGTSLGAEVAGEKRPHSRGLAAEFDHAMGGRVENSSVLGSKAGFSPLMDHFRGMFGSDIYVMSGSRPGSITTSGNVSNHSSGNAIDISNPTIAGASAGNPPPQTNIDRLHGYIGANIKQPPRRDFLWRTTVGGNHFNHIHLGMDDSAVGTLAAGRRRTSLASRADRAARPAAPRAAVHLAQPE